MTKVTEVIHVNHELDLLEAHIIEASEYADRIVIKEGECTWNGAALIAADGGNGPNNFVGVIESPASLTTLVTCRG